MALLSISKSALYVLTTLAEGPAHGWDIMRSVRVLSAGEVTLGPATLYTTLKRLLTEGLIEELAEPSDSRRREYKLTSLGVAELQAEKKRMQLLLTSLQTNLK